MILLADPDSAMIDPVCEMPTLSLTCDVYDPLSRLPYSRDPRYIAKKSVEYLKGTGIADTAYIGPEAEFFVFDKIMFSAGECGGHSGCRRSWAASRAWPGGRGWRGRAGRGAAPSRRGISAPGGYPG